MLEIVITFTLFVVLVILWTIDMAETVSFVDREGLDVEQNPVAKFFLKHSDMDFIIFKIGDLIFLILIIYYIRASNIFMADVLLFIFILIYIITVVHNYITIKETQKEETNVKNIMQFDFNYMSI
ncbi:MAG: hypothetical protein K0B02_01360 [DPANN group archaeon]|nr:hypothetical protein [DPANN group archaeon]